MLERREPHIHGQAKCPCPPNSKNYPLETGANLPPPPYYIRGTGTQYQSFNRLESEQLDTKWARKMSISKREVRGEFYNTASYAPWVHGRTKQTGIHTSRLWRNVDKILKDNYPKILNNFKSAIRYALTIK